MPVLVSTLPRPLSDADKEGLSRIYADSPEFEDIESALFRLENAVLSGAQLYVGIFNQRAIAAVLVEGASETRQMRYLCVHPATRGRGVADRLISEVRRLEAERGTHWLEADFDLNQEGVSEMLLSMGFIPKGDGHYSYRISG
jgi:GNAT superfamily N-acetyltransferase